MSNVIMYYTLLTISLINGVVGMVLILQGDMTGFISLGLAVYLQYHSIKHKEPAIVILAIRRAGYVVRRCSTEYTTEREIIEMFNKELLAELLRRNIENAEEKAASLAVDYDKDFK